MKRSGQPAFNRGKKSGDRINNRQVAYLPRAQYRNRFPKSGGKELKVVDTNIAGNCDTTGSVTALNLIAVGDDYTTRDGRKVCIKSVQIKGIVSRASVVAANAAQLCRVMLVWDKSPNGAAISAIGDILTTATSFSSNNLSNRERYLILMDKFFSFGALGFTATQTFSDSSTTGIVNKYIKMNKDMVFNTTTAVIAAIQSGALHCVCIGSNAAATGANFTGAARVRFTDA